MNEEGCLLGALYETIVTAVSIICPNSIKYLPSGSFISDNGVKRGGSMECFESPSSFSVGRIHKSLWVKGGVESLVKWVSCKHTKYAFFA